MSSSCGKKIERSMTSTSPKTFGGESKQWETIYLPSTFFFWLQRVDFDRMEHSKETAT
jgi:hypothetical protein